jgi:AraC-like DNA-binding protein
MIDLQDPWAGCSQPTDYFSGLRTPYACPVDNLLGFVRRRPEDLAPRPGESQRHHRWVWILHRKGQGVSVLRGRPFPTGPGDMILIPGYTPHLHQADPGEELEWCFLTFECENSHWRSRLGERVWRPGSAARERFDRAADLMFAGKAAEAALTLSLFHEALLRDTAEEIGPEDRWLARIQEWAREVEGTPTVGVLAEELGGSESHLRARFREKTGLSLGGYLRHLRMVRAVEDLHDPRWSVTEVAYRAGYANPGNFSRAFARELGVSPRRFRERLVRD